jgi:hypothetical protein
VSVFGDTYNAFCLTGCNGEQLLLHPLNQVLDLLCWPSPEDEAMTRVYETRFNRGIGQSQQYRVYADTGEVFIEHLCFLLSISRSSMQSVLLLNLCLRSSSAYVLIRC